MWTGYPPKNGRFRYFSPRKVVVLKKQNGAVEKVIHKTGKITHKLAYLYTIEVDKRVVLGKTRAAYFKIRQNYA